MTREKGAVMKKIELTEYINKIANDFKETLVRNITFACLIDYDEVKDNGITLHGNEYFYVRNGFVVKVKYDRLMLDIDDDVICEITEVTKHEKKEMGIYLKGMPIEMILDMIQNFPSHVLYK